MTIDQILIVNELRIMIKGGQDRTGRYPKWDGEGAMQDQLFPGLRPSAIEAVFYLSKWSLLICSSLLFHFFCWPKCFNAAKRGRFAKYEPF